MKVKNQKCIRRLSYKSLWATRKRNVIAIFAIALTTLLFTSLFTILMSLNESYETYNFRQQAAMRTERSKTERGTGGKNISASGGSGKPENAPYVILHHRCFWKSSGRSQLHGQKLYKNGAMRHQRQEENRSRAMRSQWTRSH